jgi:hypothetical protein
MSKVLKTSKSSKESLPSFGIGKVKKNIPMNSGQDSKLVVVKTQCNCLGTRHPCVTNCTLCGYIICQFEIQENNPSSEVGKDLFQCPNCRGACSRSLTAQQMQLQGCDESTLKAYEQKDRLLQFDREHAKRTMVHDAQADYYVSSAWMTDAERKDMELKERKRLEMKKHARHNKKVNIRFDIAGRKIVEAQDEDELQLESEIVCAPDELDFVDYVHEDMGNNENKESVPLFENSELILSTSKAAEVYKHIRKS